DKKIKATAKRYRYTGKERDEETGLYYHGARYYASWLGRWTSCDPAEMADGVSLYIYVSCNPSNQIDPAGRQANPWTPFVRLRQLGEFAEKSRTAVTEAGLGLADAVVDLGKG